MLSRFRQPGLIYALTVLWMVLWVTIFPLVHVHPEADHAHGAATHHHGGLVHSVLSEDLPCEFGTHSHSSSTSQPHFTSLPLTAHSHSHVLSHAEYTFSALTPFSDLPIKKQIPETVVIGIQDQALPYGVDWEKVTRQQIDPLFNQLIAPHFSRPPPVLTI